MEEKGVRSGASVYEIGDVEMPVRCPIRYFFPHQSVANLSSHYLPSKKKKNNALEASTGE